MATEKKKRKLDQDSFS